MPSREGTRIARLCARYHFATRCDRYRLTIHLRPPRYEPRVPIALLRLHVLQENLHDCMQFPIDVLYPNVLPENLRTYITNEDATTFLLFHTMSRYRGPRDVLHDANYKFAPKDIRVYIQSLSMLSLHMFFTTPSTMRTTSSHRNTYALRTATQVLAPQLIWARYWRARLGSNSYRHYT